MEQSIYQAPASDVIQQDDQTAYGSVEKAITGDYNFSIGETLSEAWAKTSGAKLPIHLGYLIMMAVTFGVSMVFGLVTVVLGLGATVASASPTPGLILGTLLIEQSIILLATMPIWAGLIVMGIQRSINAPLAAGTTLKYYHKALPILGLMLVMYLFATIGFFLLVIPGIYLIYSYAFALPLMAEKDMGIWNSLETSRKAVTKRWFAFFGLFTLLFFINLIAMIPLFIGLIWTIPLTHIAMGIAYRNMFGVEAQTSRL